MLYSNLLKRKGRILLQLTIIALGSFFFVSRAFADRISPLSTEATLSAGEISKQTVTIENEKDVDIYITPELYKYYPKSEYIQELEPFEEFILIDTDYIKIPSNSSVEIPFQIVAPNTLDIGTHYNLIIFQHTNQTEDEKSSIGTSGALSHIVKLNLTDSSNLEKITEDYDIELQVIERGIPFIRPTRLKFLFFNNSPYILIPTGEIQVVKKSENKEPEYIKINTDRIPVYPQDSLEKEYEVENWYIEDIFFGKSANIRIQNGLDDNVVVTREIQIPGFRNEFLYILATITVVILLARSIQSGDTKPEPEYAE